MNLVLLGKPGAGKGSVCEVFAKYPNIVHVSTGEIFRKEIASGSELGQLANSFIKDGNLVPDDVTNNIMASLLRKAPNKDYIFDGYPRTVAQAEFLEKIMKELNIKLDAVCDLYTDDSLVITRLSSRRVCRSCGAIYNTRNHMPKVDGVCDSCGGEIYIRKDDEEESIKERLLVYEAKTKPLIDYYQEKGLLLKVNGNLAPEEVFTEIMESLGQAL